jgi:ketosteroid isomerase-like protein
MSQENIETLKRGYEAFNRGDTSVLVELAREIATPDVEWGVTGAFPGVEGMYRGPEAMQRWMEVIRSEWKDFEVTLDEILYDSGDVLAVTERLRGPRTRKRCRGRDARLLGLLVPTREAPEESCLHRTGRSPRSRRAAGVVQDYRFGRRASLRTRPDWRNDARTNRPRAGATSTSHINPPLIASDS